MSDPCARIIEEFTAWLYDTCPVNPEEVTREALVDLWMLYEREGTTPLPPRAVPPIPPRPENVVAFRR